MRELCDKHKYTDGFTSDWDKDGLLAKIQNESGKISLKYEELVDCAFVLFKRLMELQETSDNAKKLAEKMGITIK
jgi:hypothetical protein